MDLAISAMMDIIQSMGENALKPIQTVISYIFQMVPVINANLVIQEPDLQMVNALMPRNFVKLFKQMEMIVPPVIQGIV